MSRSVTLLLFLVVSMSANAQDPWESTNRQIFGFNTFLDTVLLRPVAVIYSENVPRPLKQGIGNFFGNLGEIRNFANNLLQLKVDRALEDGARFTVNSTVGIAGILDIASGWGLQRNEEDFGQTLASWNLDSGPFLELPFFGPSTVRDAFGRLVDVAFNPLILIDHVPTRVVLTASNEIDYRSSVLALDALVVGDRYLFLRESFLQRREYLINDGVVEDMFGDDFSWNFESINSEISSDKCGENGSFNDVTIEAENCFWGNLISYTF